jgi:hypothetical protein
MKIKLNRYPVVLFTVVLLSTMTFTAKALPMLQLDIIGGVYDTNTATIVTAEDAVTLVAYGNKDRRIVITGDYYVSFALYPGVAVGVDFGTFDFAGVTYDTGDMVFGTPAVDIAANNLGLATHGIFPTLFNEVAFKFVAGQTSASVNTQDVTGNDPTAPENSGDDLYYSLFEVDVSNMIDGFELHFDLYNTKVHEKSGSVSIDDFAPFSHDAGTVLPEPA